MDITEFKILEPQEINYMKKGIFIWKFWGLGIFIWKFWGL